MSVITETKNNLDHKSDHKSDNKLNINTFTDKKDKTDKTDKTSVFKIAENTCSKTFEESSFIGGMIKKIKEGIMTDSFKNEFITPVYEQVYLHIYPHYIIFFALLVSIIVLQLLIFFAIFSLLNKK